MISKKPDDYFESYKCYFPLLENLYPPPAIMITPIIATKYGYGKEYCSVKLKPRSAIRSMPPINIITKSITITIDIICFNEKSTNNFFGGFQ